MPAGGALLAAVRVLVTVLDPATGLALEGLRAEDFLSAVPVESVAIAGEPISVLLLLDASVAGEAQKPVARQLIACLREGDRMAIATFPGTQVQAFTGDKAVLEKVLAGVPYGGDPRMMDALAEAMKTRFPAGRKVVVLLTSGIEGASHTPMSEVIRAAASGGIAIYPVYLHGSGRWVFPDLAHATGGAPFWLKEVRSPEQIYRTISSPYRLTLRGAAAKIKVKGREKTFVSSLPDVTR